MIIFFMYLIFLVNGDEWNAWVNIMPGPANPSFHVVGKIEISKGQKAVLKAAIPQGINHKELILNLIINGDKKTCKERVTVRYDRHNYTGNYKTVLIRYSNGQLARIKVETIN